MGQVYHATDTKLNRQVALKILPEAFATDPDRLARFQREAQVLASLNHPNIAAIYGIEEADDTRALVLELVEGPTLADRIAQGAIPLDEALPIAKQIAEALEAAHEAGVIHRDLKPANIKVRDDGTVKVLDFGLAKALDTTPQGDPSQSPTLTAAATQMGVIMGTAAYMSPEQAKGRTVDRRSDVWAFGAVLYEMLAGRRAFVGNDVSDTLVSVFRDDPDWAALPDDMPSRVLQAVQVCLQKDPKQRVRDISAVRLAMEGAFESASAARAEELKATQLFGWRHVGLAALAGVVIGGVGVGMAPQGSSVPAARGVTRLAIPLPAGAYFSRYGGLALSPDGRTLVYAANLGGDRLYRRDLDELEAEPIAATEGARGPFFSPDGASLGFIATAGDLRKLPLDGGLPVPLAPATNQSSGTWGDDDAIYFRPFDSRGLARIRSAGGEAVPIVQSDEEILGWPDVLPGANAVLFSTYPENFDGARVVVESLVTGERRVLAAGTTPRFLSSGHVVFAREDTLWAAAFDAERLELASEPVPVVENVYINSSNGQAFYTVSGDGSLAYVSDVRAWPLRNLVWVDRSGQEEPIGAPTRPYWWPRVSPDGHRTGVHIMDPANMDSWEFDSVRTTLERRTFHAASEGGLFWTPDGDRVVFWSNRDQETQVYWRPADGTGTAERITAGPNRRSPWDWTPDGRVLVVSETNPETGRDIATLAIGADGTVKPLVDGPFNEARPDLSHDGRWLAYQSDESGTWEVFVQSFPEPGRRLQVSSGGGMSPRLGTGWGTLLPTG